VILSFTLICSYLKLGAGVALAQGGPPYLTNDPGTPGDHAWEINLAAMPSLARGSASYQVPQIDINYGVGDRIQLTYEVPYVLERVDGRPSTGGWGNGYPGFKWRFLDRGEQGWQMAIFPQLETGGSMEMQRRGIAGPGPRLFLPVEVAHSVGPLALDFEAGYYFSRNGARERILGLVAGHSMTERLELDAEIYDDRAYGAPPHATTLDLGGRYKLRRNLIALFMAGRSVNGTDEGQPRLMAYLGIQILLNIPSEEPTDSRPRP
jgi:hypothetical protein